MRFAAGIKGYPEVGKLGLSALSEHLALVNKVLAQNPFAGVMESIGKVSGLAHMVDALCYAYVVLFPVPTTYAPSAQLIFEDEGLTC